MTPRLLSVAGLAAALASCGGGDPAAPGDPNEPNPSMTVSDASLYQASTASGAWTYYRRSPNDTFPSSSGSGHLEPKLRTRYDARAATQLDAAGRVRPGALFPDSSLIVKELYTSGGQLSTLAVMYKRAGDPSAAAGGWIWGYFGPGGSVKFAVTSRGSICVSCHSSGIDYTRMNDIG